MKNFKRNASKGRRILNEGIRKDLARVLQLAAEKDEEIDFSELEDIANKYRMYYDAEGKVKEV